jgi:DNA-binding transcriptional regulator YdaS (Cro superfamily)
MIPTPDEIITALGGPKKVADLIGIKPPSVCEWRNKAAIPAASLHKLAPHIERAMGVPRHVICPDVFEPPAKRGRAA